MNAHFRIGRKYKFTQPNIFAPMASRQALEYIGYEKVGKLYVFNAINATSGAKYRQVMSRGGSLAPRVIREAQEVK